MPELADVLIIGSGPAGVHASLPLLDAGLQVTMIDGGIPAPPILERTPGNFEDVRRHNPAQHEWFLGEDLSAIPLQGIEGGHGGGMASGNRSYVTRRTDAHLPIVQQKSHVIQSLARGGLAAAWGAACAYLSDDDLTAMGLPTSEMQRHYDVITQRIGISGAARLHVQPALTPDHHAAALLKAAERKSSKLQSIGTRVTQPWSAVLTRDLNDRRACTYDDMDYYADPGRSIYRPQYTLEALMEHPTFHYAPGHVVERIEETQSGVAIHARTLEEGSPKQFHGKKIILAAGAVNTARILLRSLGLYDQPIRFVTKPHLFATCLHPRLLGTTGPKERVSLCQLLMIDETKTDDGLESACAQLYSYRSLLLFRLLPGLALPVPEAMRILALLAPAMIIADIRFPGHATAKRTLHLERAATGERIKIAGDPLSEQRNQKASLRRIYRSMRSLGLYPMRTHFLPDGSSSHYAGTVPVSEAGEFPLGANQHGAVHGFREADLADASLFRCLSPLPHTLTIMANANRIGEHVAGTLQG